MYKLAQCFVKIHVLTVKVKYKHASVKTGENADRNIYQPHQAKRDEKAKEKLIIGTIIDITDEHILIEDSLLCKNPEDAITIKIMLEDVRIARYIELDVIGVGDTVQIIYDDKIIVDDIYIVDSAVSINKVFIDEKNIIIPE